MEMVAVASTSDAEGSTGTDGDQHIITEPMLNFEQDIFNDASQRDGLWISAKGLNMNDVITNLLRVYCDPGNLIIVLNSSDAEEKHFIKQLNSVHVYRSTYQTLQNQREEMYINGGIHFITTRILVVDLLKKRVPIERITGIFVLRAHTVLESCQEAFALRLYRQSNKTGFIKAFSHCAQSFTIGFGHVEKVMRSIFVKELVLWPRFHSTVVQDLCKHEPVVEELHIPISELLHNAQTSILELMNQTVREIKSINRTLELQEITVENCITKKFHKILHAQLDYVWFQLSSKTKQLVADLKTLRHLITTMINSDSVTFYALVSNYMTAEYAMSTSWVIMDSADALFATVKQMMYNGSPLNKELNPKICPKWEVLNEILKVDIPTDISRLREKHHKISPPKILLLCNDTDTCFQLQQVLTHGPETFLFLNVLKHHVPFTKIAPEFCKQLSARTRLDVKGDTTIIEQKIFEILSMCDGTSAAKKSKLNVTVQSDLLAGEINTILQGIDEHLADANNKDRYLLTMSQPVTAECSTINESQFNFELFPEMESMNLTEIETDNPMILIRTFKNKPNAPSLQQSLHELRPNYVIMYHSDMATIRQIEVYEAKNQHKHPLKVYFLIHSGTVEEQSYLTTLRREKEAFEFLIETKSKMVVPDYQDGKTEDCLLLQRDVKVSPEKSTRKATTAATTDSPIIPKIIVDMREFRSELPALIHRRGIHIEPVTITVGDYILTPEICIERKSISDLVQSLNSGRLYTQCVQMTRYYSKPMLLIEFDQNKPFHFHSSFMVSNDVSNKDIQEKLQLLTLHFPKLKLIWSPSPYATAQLFEELKESKEQPISEYASRVSNAVDMEVVERKYNSVIYDFVQKLPGITSKNIDGLLQHGKSLDHIIKLSEDELKELARNAIDAKSLYNIIHDKHNVDQGESSNVNGKPRFNRWKNRNKNTMLL